MLRVCLVYKGNVSHFDHPQGPLEFGRGPARAVPRRILDDPFVSGDQLLIEELPRERLRIRNLSRRFPIRLAAGVAVAPEAECEVGLPIRLEMGETTLQVEASTGEGSAPDQDSLQTVALPIRPGDSPALAPLPATGESVEAPTLARWFEAVLVVQRASASSDAFFRQTAQAVVELVGLDRGLVLRRSGEGWETIALHPDDAAGDQGFSRAVLERVAREGRTFYQEFTEADSSASLAGVGAVVAAPVLLGDGRVEGVVYGSRARRSGRTAAAIRPLEAQLVQVLAAAVGAGLARVESEADAARRLVQFEQFVSPELARELDRDPDLLDWRDREVTILFSDLRNSSRLAERLSPRENCRLVGDVMERLSTCVLDHGGAIVDYAGDGLMAMWNAPVDQPTHAELACRAALAMRAELPSLNETWQDLAGGPIGLGIGLNTGPALVGNTGSRRLLKYGPHGHTVNVASRVEGATKHFGVPLLITGSTRDRLPGSFAVRRLGRTRVVGIVGAVDLFELHAVEAAPEWCARRDTYEAGLALYESGHWTEACETLYALITGRPAPHDRPTLSLIARAIDCLKSPPAAFDPTFELSAK